MTTDNGRAALVTGATSGLGFEAAAQMAEQGYAKVTITGRNAERATAAGRQLGERTGRDVFETLAVDFNLPESVKIASDDLVARNGAVDVLLLNAGVLPGSEQVKTDAGVDITYASSLIGHHQLTAALLSNKLLTETARIIITGSEAARDDVPTMNVADLGSLADEHFDGDLDAAAVALIRGNAPIKYKSTNTYATSKLFVAWWAAALAPRLPNGMTVNAVSPGSAPDTGVSRDQNAFMRKIMVPLMKLAPARLGLAATTATAAARYLAAADFADDVTGQFFASAPKRMTGPIQRMQQPHLLNIANQTAGWNATARHRKLGPDPPHGRPAPPHPQESRKARR